MPLQDDRGGFDREILDIIPERFDSDPDSQYARKGAHTRLILTVALALLAVAALGVAARHIFFGETTKVQADAGVPVIRADDKPIKTKPGPDDRGGMEVPNRDKLVYERMGSAESESQSERLLPPPEQPQAPPNQPRKPSIKPAFPAPPTKEVTPAPAPALVAPKAAEAPPPAMSAPAAPVAAGPAPKAPAAAMAAAAPPPAPAPAKAAPKAEAAPPPPVAKAASGGGWVVQLAALKSDSEAKAEWSRIHSANKDIVGHLSSDIVRVDLGTKGIYWRVRAGPLDEAQARTICAQLSKRNQGCIIAKK